MLHDNDISVGDIIAVSFHAVLNVLLHGKTWASPELNRLQDEGRIRLQVLGAYVQDADGRNYDVQQVTSPVQWTNDQDLANMEVKMEIVSQLLQKAVQIHDRILLEQIGTGRAIVSRQYHYDLSGTFFPSPGMFQRSIYTAFAVLPAIASTLDQG